MIYLKLKLGIALALLATLPLPALNAAPIDREISILAADQPKDETPTHQSNVSRQNKKSQQEIEAEEKRLREERRAEEKRVKEEREAARRQIEEGKREEIPIRENNNRRTSNTRRDSSTDRTSDRRQTSATSEVETSPNNVRNEISERTAVEERRTTTSNADERRNVTSTTSTVGERRNTNSNVQNQPTTSRTNTATDTPSVGLPNPMREHASFEDLAKTVGFTPLYLPKKSGYTVNNIFSIDNKVAEIRYGRRWEPEVSLQIRTYKRATGEELKDISGVNGVKWRIDTTGDTTVYIAKVNDDTNVAAWAVGDYTFSAFVENLSFAAFHALIVEELVDLSNHYYV